VTPKPVADETLGDLPVWNLADLYASPEAPELAADLEATADKAKAFRQRLAGKLAACDGAALGAAVADYEAIQESYVIADDTRILRVLYVQPLNHVNGMLMAYLPAEGIAFQADLFDTHDPPKAAQLPAMRSLDNQVKRMNLNVETLAPVHGNPVPWSDFTAALASLAGSE